MRVNVLVVAAMVITSVNAGLIKESKDLSSDDLNQESVQSKEEDVFQESEPTKNGQYDDSDDAEKTKICNRMLFIAEKIQASIFDLADDFRINLPIPDAPNRGANDLEPEAREGHAEFYSQIRMNRRPLKKRLPF
ncbi:hypothetical protein BASA83_012563 [Batrachochytrium salamandrivorans]|nr:hypothetical protein BASA83_012563 [Batrachochytrium salamandrivorans]